MLSELCAATRNYFVRSDKNKHYGTFTINRGTFSPPLDFLQNGQYYAVFGSVFNDGVHQYGSGVLKDETFEGAIWAMAIPRAFLDLAERIRQYRCNDISKESPYMSESFGGYSYTRLTDGNGGVLGWKDIFAKDLSAWRKI